MLNRYLLEKKSVNYCQPTQMHINSALRSEMQSGQYYTMHFLLLMYICSVVNSSFSFGLMQQRLSSLAQAILELAAILLSQTLEFCNYKNGPPDLASYVLFK